MIHLQFRDSDKQSKLKDNTIITLLSTRNVRENVVVEFHVITGNWHCGMLTDVEIESMKKNRPDKWKDCKPFFDKFLPDQKRKEISNEEFNELFKLL